MSASLKPPTPLWDRASRPLLETHALATARLWLASGAWALLMLGGVGRGKSLAAAWLWHQLRAEALSIASRPAGVHADSGRPIYRRAGDTLWLRARELQQLSGWDQQTGRSVRGEVLERCAGATGLVVDEMGAEDERVSQSIAGVLEQRADAGRRTVMTSNLNGQAFLKRYGDRLTSRLRAGGTNEDGGSRWAVMVQGDDLRGSDDTDDGESDTAQGNAGSGPLATPDFMAKVLAESAPEVAMMVNGLIRRSAGGGL
jgi:hypothetical protein